MPSHEARALWTARCPPQNGCSAAPSCGVDHIGTKSDSESESESESDSIPGPGSTAAPQAGMGWLPQPAMVRNPQVFPTWARIPNHRGTHLGNPDPRTMMGLSHAAQTITANCAHGGCQSCLVSATIKENCGTNHVLPRLRLPSLASAGHRCGENRR